MVNELKYEGIFQDTQGIISTEEMVGSPLPWSSQ